MLKALKLLESVHEAPQLVIFIEEELEVLVVIGSQDSAVETSALGSIPMGALRVDACQRKLLNGDLDAYLTTRCY